MKKTKFYLLFISLLLVYSGYGQLSGTKNIPGDYATLAAAITDLNTQGVGAGGVTLNLVAGNPETAPLGGYSITATGTVANTITITGNGNTITAPTPQTAGNLNDAIFKIIGGDYITIQGFTMQENTSNTTTTAGTNNMTEWGVAVLYASATDGAKNVTVQNNTISLNRAYQNTFGIYSSNRHTATDVITAADISASSGANDNLKIYTNAISNINIGICVVGSLTDAFMATGLDIGGGSAGTGNTLTDFGTTGTFSAYVSVTSGAVNGIYVNNNLNVNVSYNSVTSSVGGTTSGSLFGIVVEATGTLPTTGSITTAINNNSISIKSGLASGLMQGIVNTLGNGITTYTINNNDFNNSGHTVSPAGGIINFILSSSPAISATVNGNTFTGLVLNTTNAVRLIYKGASHPANAVINVNNNVVTSLNKTGAGNSVQGYLSDASSPSSAAETNSNNNFSNITVTGATTLTAWQNTDGSSKTITGNTFTNLTGGTSTVTGLQVSFGNNSISNNTINTIAGGGAITAVNISNIANQSFFNNTINGLSTTGGSIVTGLSINAGATVNYYKNKIYDLTLNNSGTAGNVFGIRVNNGATVANNIYDNLIGDLKAPQTSNIDVIRGISVGIATANTSLNIAFNTIYINATSSGANFGSSGIFHTYNATSTSATLNLRNNIIVNTSTPNGTGLTVAFRRSAATDLNNYGALSNNNLFYAGTPGANRLIFYDGTNADQTLAAYKTRVASRDANSMTESPTFLSTTGSSANFLHINPSVATQIESGGIAIAGIIDDFDGNTRNGTIPDIGADEFNGPRRVVTRIFLQGAYNAGLGRHKDVTSAWAAVLNANGLSQPYNTAAFGNYAGTESVSAGFFTSSADTTNITDWVLLELRDATTPSTVVTRRAAFVREDGYIVDLDGVSNVLVSGIAAGNYYLVIRHRNHLSVRSSVSVSLDGALSSNSPSLYDFTISQAQAFQDGAITTNAAMRDLGGAVFGLWAGNVNANTNVKYTGSGNDVLALLAVLGGNQSTPLLNVYSFADLNLDGTVRYTGSGNDVLVITSALNGNQAATFTQHQ